MIAFAGELVMGLRRDHGAVWLPGRRRTADEQAFAVAAEALAARLGEVGEALRGLRDTPPREALAALAAFDGAGLLAAAQALDGLARKLRAVSPAGRAQVAPAGCRLPAQPGRPPGAAARPPGPGARGAAPVGVMGLLRRWTSPPVARAEPAAPGPPVPTARDKARQAFEAAHKLAREVLAYVSPRLTVLGVALEATGLPGPRRPMEEVKRTLHPAALAAGVAEPQLPFLPPLVKLFFADDAAVRRVQPAIVQWRGVQATTVEAEVLRSALRGAGPARAEALLAAFETGRYRAALYPLTHLHLTFRGVPLVSELFPMPADPGGAALSAGDRPARAAPHGAAPAG